MRRQSKIIYGLLAVLWLTPLAAHEGQSHSHEAVVSTNTTHLPRFAVTGEQIEVVGVLAQQHLMIYVDQYHDNSPISDAEVTVEGSLTHGTATPVGDGVYQLAVPKVSTGDYPLTISVTNAQISDLFSASLTIAQAANQTTAVNHHHLTWYGLGAAVLLMILAYVFLAKGKRRG